MGLRLTVVRQVTQKTKCQSGLEVLGRRSSRKPQNIRREVHL